MKKVTIGETEFELPFRILRRNQRRFEPRFCREVKKLFGVKL